MPRAKKAQTTDTVYKIENEICFVATHGCPTSCTLVADFPHGKTVSKVQVCKDAEGNFYLVLKE